MARNRGGSEGIKRKIVALNRAKSDLPNKLAEASVTFFKKSFRNQGWQDQSTQKWKPRKGDVSRGISNISSKSSSGRAILVKSGHLRKSVHKAYANWKKIRVESDLPYAAIHNYGLTGMAYGKHKFKMPQRKFMGNSYALRKILLSKIQGTMQMVMSK